MIRTLACAITLSTLSVVLPIAVFAQSTTDQISDVRKNARIHVGPVYATPSLQLKEFGVDTNVFNDAGDQKSDFMFTLAPKADVWVPIARRALVSTQIGTDLVYYARYGSERSVDPSLRGRVDIFLRRLSFFSEGAVLNTRQRPNFELDLRSRHIERSIAGGAEYRLTPKFSVEASTRRSTVDYDADEFLGTSLRKTLNRTTMSYAVAIRHRLTPLTTLSARGEDFHDTFEFSPERDADSLRVTGGVEFKPRALINGSAQFGVRRFTPKNSALIPAFTGFAASGALSYTFLGSTTFGVSLSRDAHYSFEELFPYFVSTSLGGSLRRAVGTRFDVIGAVDRHVYRYRDLQTQPELVPASARVDTTWNYQASVGYRPNRTARIGFGISYWKRDSATLDFRDYDGLRIGTTVTYGF